MSPATKQRLTQEAAKIVVDLCEHPPTREAIARAEEFRARSPLHRALLNNLERSWEYAAVVLQQKRKH